MKKLAISLLVFIISLILVVSIGLIITGCVNTISGGTVILEDDSLAIKLMGIKFVSRITAPPKNVDNIWVMELDGITFTKQ
jgi:hypothetical protein